MERGGKLHLTDWLGASDENWMVHARAFVAADQNLTIVCEKSCHAPSLRDNLSDSLSCCVDALRSRVSLSQNVNVSSRCTHVVGDFFFFFFFWCPRWLSVSLKVASADNVKVIVARFP